MSELSHVTLNYMFDMELNTWNYCKEKDQILP